MTLIQLIERATKFLEEHSGAGEMEVFYQQDAGVYPVEGTFGIAPWGRDERIVLMDGDGDGEDEGAGPEVPEWVKTTPDTANWLSGEMNKLASQVAKKMVEDLMKDGPEP